MSPPSPTSSTSLQVKRTAVFLFAVASILLTVFFLVLTIIYWVNEDKSSLIQNLTASSTQFKVRVLIYFIVHLLIHFFGVFAAHTQRRDATTFYGTLIFLLLILTVVRVALGEVVSWWLILNGLWNVAGLFAITLYQHHLKHIEAQYEAQP